MPTGTREETPRVLAFRAATAEDAEDIEAVRLAGWQRAYRGIVADAYLDAMTGNAERRRRQLLDPATGRADLVAVDDGHLVGWIAIGPSRDADANAGADGEVYACYVRPARWRQGIGGELLRQGIARLLAAGYRDITLWVLAANDGARRCYERAGFRPDGSQQELDLGGPVVEVRYRRSAGAAYPDCPAGQPGNPAAC